MDTYVRERTQIHDHAAFEKALEGRAKMKQNICKQTNAHFVYRHINARLCLFSFYLQICTHEMAQFFDGTFENYAHTNAIKSYLLPLVLTLLFLFASLLYFSTTLLSKLGRHRFRISLIQSTQSKIVSHQAEKNIVEDSLNVINDTTQWSQSHTFKIAYFSL